jgi:hypothetical protein
MKRWIILLMVLPLAGVCFAEMDSNQVMRVRKELRDWGGGMLACKSFPAGRSDGFSEARESDA